MAIVPTPWLCVQCGEPACWLVEDVAGAGTDWLARSCDDHLAEVIRDLDTAPVAVSEVIG